LLLAASQMTAYAAVSTVVTLASSTSCQPQLSSGLQPISPVPVGHHEDSLLHETYEDYIADDVESMSERNVVDCTPGAPVSSSLMNVLISTLSGLFTVVSPCRCNFSDRVDCYCRGSVANGDCHYLPISEITRQHNQINMPLSCSFFTADSSTNVSKNYHQVVMISWRICCKLTLVRL